MRRLKLSDLGALRIVRKPRLRSMTRAARRARAPAQPRGIELFYTSAIVTLLREQQRQILDALDIPRSHRRRDTSAPAAIAIARLRTEFVGVVTEEHLTDLLTKVVKRVDKLTMAETARVVGIKIADLPELRPYIDKFRRENVALIQSVSVEQLDRVSAVLDDAAKQGRRVEDIAVDVQEQFDVSESRAELIARDQVLKANADITQMRHVRAGITEYVWTTTGDVRVREDHRKLDGQRFSYDDPPVTDERTGERNPPGKDFQCRCVADPILDDLL